MTPAEKAIREIVDRETRAWDTKDVAMLLTVFHPDMVWPWPPTADQHDPIDWILNSRSTERVRSGQRSLSDLLGSCAYGIRQQAGVHGHLPLAADQ